MRLASRYKRDGIKMTTNVENARLNHLVNKYAVKRNNEIVLDENTNLIDDLGYDSISIIQLLTEIGNDLEISIEYSFEFTSFRYLNMFYCIHSMFNEYYKRYLGITKDGIINENIVVYCSINRDHPINKRYLYSGIITYYNQNWILSCDSKNKEYFFKKMKHITLENYDTIMQKLKIDGYEIRKMYRMIIDKEVDVREEKEEEYDYIYIDEMNKYVAKSEEETIGYCKISDIDFGFGNIVVYIDENHRHQGLGSTLLNMMVQKCLELNINPVYVVDSLNNASINLAAKFGFSIASTEVIISKTV